VLIFCLVKHFDIFLDGGYLAMSRLFPKSIKAVVFDLDNTLVSSTLNFSEIREQLGCPDNEDLLEFVGKLSGGDRLSANQTILDHELADALSATKLPGTDELLNLLSSLGIPVAIVTRNCELAANLKLKHTQLDIPIVLTREHHKAKPAPDALYHLSDQWGMPTENMLYVGDYIYDLQTAQNANTMSCLVSYGKKLTFSHLADVVVCDLLELVAIIDRQAKAA